MSNRNVAVEYTDESKSRSNTTSPKPRRHKSKETKTESCYSRQSSHLARMTIGTPLGQVMNDAVAKEVEAIWKKAFLDAVLIPNTSQGVMMLMHSLSLSPLVINGLKSVSPLVNQAIFSSECSGSEDNKKSLNFYVVRMPDLPGKNGRKSTVHVYLDSLAKESLNVSSVATPWHGTSKQIKEIHHQNCGLSAKEFSERTIRALQTALNTIAHRMKH